MVSQVCSVSFTSSVRCGETLQSVDNLRILARNQTFGVNISNNISDPLEVFSDDNDSGMSIDIVLHGSDDPLELSRVHLESDRANPQGWKGNLFFGPNDRPVVENSNGQLVDATTGKLVDHSSFRGLCADLANTLYVGPFRNAISEGEGKHYDLAIGRSFIATWNSWKTGTVKAQSRVIQQVEEEIGRIFEYDRLEINAAEDLKTLQVITNRNPYKLRELGAGLAQFIIVLGNVVIKRPHVLLIDEPELNLHPALQMDFLTTLASYTKLGTVFFATHSVGLARTTADRIYTFRRSGPRSVVTSFEQTPNLAEFLGEMSFASFKELGHDSLLLVEGVRDIRAVQQFLRLLKKDHRTVVIHLGGGALINANAQHELAELGRLSQHVAGLIDSERENAGANLNKDRAAFVKTCQDLHFNLHVTKFRAFENYFPERAVQAVKGTQAQALKPYQLLAQAAVPWRKRDNWLIARAMTVEELMATELGPFLAGLP